MNKYFVQIKIIQDQSLTDCIFKSNEFLKTLQPVDIKSVNFNKSGVDSFVIIEYMTHEQEVK